MLIRSLALVIAAVFVVVVAGVSGLSFLLWPTSLGDHDIQVTQSMLTRLQAMQRERKFQADATTFYPGAPNEPARAQAQASVDAVIGALLTELPRSPRRSTVLGIVKSALARFTTGESEEREQFAVYLQRVMAIVGVKDSGELLNVWRYGFPYGWMFWA